MNKRFKAGLLATVLAATAALAGCGSDDDGETLSIVGFAVPEAANKAIADQFKKTDDGDGVKFRTSYGASGDQSRAVASGLDADYVHFSVASDVTRLVDEGLIDENWDDGENKGVVSRSIVVFGVREGNPKNIQSWEDLVKPGVEIVTPNPASSGAARWNALAAYGQITSNGGTDAEATDYIDKFFANVVSLPGSGRDATTAFLNGTGDVLMAYENEAILANQSGQGFDYVIPETTMLIENPGAILKDSDELAQKWLDFVISDEGQKQFALKGFRPIRDDVDFGGTVEGAADPSEPFPAVSHLLTVDNDFESWEALSDKFFDESNGIVTKAIAKSGKAS
ncbi:sulfate ABC transporter substrate-binding protein [Nocardioides alcanivorans]|uniref:sulfate ABC transporter substrate-binding protein n=1 Tax=Nocardioides alcanivorans TaxID=2897352 RepID=UPI001F269EBC|nr:sulfate ABC transporter substrate-binding protein [Nocardioides alcanivorans]